VDPSCTAEPDEVLPQLEASSKTTKEERDSSRRPSQTQASVADQGGKLTLDGEPREGQPRC